MAQPQFLSVGEGERSRRIAVLTQTGKAQIKTVMTNAATGAQSLETAYAKLG